MGNEVIILALTNGLVDAIRKIASEGDPLLARQYAMLVMDEINGARDVPAENEAYAHAHGFPNFISMQHEEAAEQYPDIMFKSED
jgi:hypothetical protein